MACRNGGSWRDHGAKIFVVIINNVVLFTPPLIENFAFQ